MIDPIWLAAFKELLCRMYREWGGDCDILPQGVSGRIAVLVNTYQTNGDPPLSSDEAIQAFLSLLTEVETALDEPGNCLEAADDSAIRTLITDLRTDFGAMK